MRTWKAGAVSRVAGITVRTLHHYDALGLLSPTRRSEAGYRLYVESDLLRLQQILLYRQLGLPLDDIRRILDDPEFDLVTALERHLRATREGIARLGQVAETIERTLDSLRKEDEMLSVEEMYKGLAPAEVERLRREARERYGERIVEDSEQRVRGMSREAWEQVGAEGEAVNRGLAALMDRAPSDPQVQALVARHYAWIEHFWHPTAETYRALGQGYAQDPAFRAYYEAYRPGLAQFLAEAMAVFADNVLEAREEA
ncbi:MAG: MerR family transcriptional regulator [Anaerolineae bacterium]